MGSKNVRVLEWERIKDAFLTVHTERANRILATLEDEKFLDAYLKMLEYFKPKLARSEVTNTDNTQIQINVNWDDDTKFIHTATKAALKPRAGAEGGEAV
jgi:transcriptional regulator of nitric oxide reductase